MEVEDTAEINSLKDSNISFTSRYSEESGISVREKYTPLAHKTLRQIERYRTTNDQRKSKERKEELLRREREHLALAYRSDEAVRVMMDDLFASEENLSKISRNLLEHEQALAQIPLEMVETIYNILAHRIDEARESFEQNVMEVKEELYNVFSARVESGELPLSLEEVRSRIDETEIILVDPLTDYHADYGGEQGVYNPYYRTTAVISDPSSLEIPQYNTLVHEFVHVLAGKVFSYDLDSEGTRGQLEKQGLDLGSNLNFPFSESWLDEALTEIQTIQLVTGGKLFNIQDVLKKIEAEGVAHKSGFSYIPAIKLLGKLFEYDRRNVLSPVQFRDAYYESVNGSGSREMLTKTRHLAKKIAEAYNGDFLPFLNYDIKYSGVEETLASFESRVSKFTKPHQAPGV